MVRNQAGRFEDDPELLFLENNVALAIDIIEYAREIKDISDDPDVLLRAGKIEITALIVQLRTKNYRKERNER